MKVVEDTGSIERAQQLAQDPDEYFARGRAEVEAEARRVRTAAEKVHLIADGEAVTSCCGRTPFELPSTERITVDPQMAEGCGR